MSVFMNYELPAVRVLWSVGAVLTQPHEKNRERRSLFQKNNAH
jgi:hypothetical protein